MTLLLRIVSKQFIKAPQPRLHNDCCLTCTRFRLFPVRSPLLRESLFDFFSSGYLDVSVLPVPLRILFIHIRISGLLPDGLLHSDVSGSKVACTSPELFAACHVLHRHPAPRHPPCALIILTYLKSRIASLPTFFFCMCDFQRSSQRIILWQPDGSLVVIPFKEFLLRKEVIQPHLPIRLPCYDFTPITGPTLGGCLHFWLAHRLRVLPTLVV